MKKKILVAGGEGYIGQVVSSDLVSWGYDVISYDNLIYNQLVNKKLESNINFHFIRGDIRDENNIKKVLKNVYGVVILAGLVGDPITKKYPEISVDINETGIKNLIDICIEVNLEKVIFVSTCSNYGLIKDDEIADENHSLNPLSSYANSKVKTEKYILSLKNKIDTCFTILRFATAFGLSTRMRYDLTVNEFTRDIFNKKKLEVYDPDTWRPYCHVKDFSEIIKKIIEEDKKKVFFEVFNAGSNVNNFTKRMITDKILSYIPSNEVLYINKKGSDPRNYKVDFSKLKNILGYECQFSVDDGIKEIIENLQNHKNNSSEKDINFGNYKIKI